MINDSVKKMLQENTWDVATCANNQPYVVPVTFKEVLEDGKLAIGDIFLEVTLDNLKASEGKIAISVYSTRLLEGYQIHGVAEYVTEGEIVDMFKMQVEKMFHGGLTAKGALLIAPTKVIETTPGAMHKM